jgi:zinc transporter ZupT
MLAATAVMFVMPTAVMFATTAGMMLTTVVMCVIPRRRDGDTNSKSWLGLATSPRLLR